MKGKPLIRWIRIGGDLIQVSNIVSVDLGGLRWLKTSDGATHLIPSNQRSKMAKYFVELEASTL